MPVKKIVFIIMCSLLAVMLVLSVVTVMLLTGVVQGTDAPPESTAPSQDGTQAPTPPLTDSSGNIHTHAYSTSKKVSPTCTEEGYTIYQCQCGERELRDPVKAYGHSYGAEKVVAPTCSEQGYTQRVCSRCEHAEKSAYTNATGAHRFSLVENHDASCTEDAWKVSKCGTCGKTNTEVLNGTATGHKFEAWTGDKCICSNSGCSIYISASDLAIRNNYLPGTQMSGQIHYTIEVGTETMQKLFTYNVDDCRSKAGSSPLSIQYLPQEGLVLSYTDANGLPQRIVLPRFADGYKKVEDSSAPPATDSPTQQPTEDPSEAGTSPTDTTDPSGSADPE